MSRAHSRDWRDRFIEATLRGDFSARGGAVRDRRGDGVALEYPISGVLCDARILDIVEGAAEIQAQVIARRLVEW